MNEDAQSDLQTLFPRIAAGDEKAFAEVFSRYYDVIYSTALQYCKTRQLAEDVVQQVFAALWQKRAALADVKNGEGWLWTLARNYAITSFKKESRNLQYVTYVKELFLQENETPLRKLLLREKQEIINAAISSLPGRQQQVYRMSRHQGATYAQIAQALGIGAETVKEHLAKALKTLREALRARKSDLMLFAAFYFIYFF